MDPEAKSWLIKRNCSASPRQLALVFGSVVAISFAFGVGFASLGLWMVLPFVGIELIAIAAAFICYGRHAADYERIAVTPQAVSVEQVYGSHSEKWQLDPRASRVKVESDGPRWRRRVNVLLVAPGLELELGRHLLDENRRRFARELDTALLSARVAPCS